MNNLNAIEMALNYKTTEPKIKVRKAHNKFGNLGKIFLFKTIGKHPVFVRMASRFTFCFMISVSFVVYFLA